MSGKRRYMTPLVLGDIRLGRAKYNKDNKKAIYICRDAHRNVTALKQTYIKDLWMIGISKYSW